VPEHTRMTHLFCSWNPSS